MRIIYIECLTLPGSFLPDLKRNSHLGNGFGLAIHTQERCSSIGSVCFIVPVDVVGAVEVPMTWRCSWEVLVRWRAVPEWVPYFAGHGRVASPPRGISDS